MIRRNGINYTKAKVKAVDNLHTGIEVRTCEFEPAKVLGLDEKTQGYEIEI